MRTRAGAVLRSVWSRIRRRRARTIVAILGIGVTIYIALTSCFAAVYLYSHSIGDSMHHNVVRFADAFYFSFVSFMTIGYGDLSPSNDFGKVVLFLETICSVLFNGLFPSVLIYYAIKRPESIQLSSRLLVTTDKLQPIRTACTFLSCESPIEAVISPTARWCSISSRLPRKGSD